VQRARDHRLGRRAIATMIVCLLVSVALAWVVLFSPWLSVRQLQLVGNDRFSTTELQAIAAPSIGRPLARVNTDALAAAVATAPSVKEAQVVRVWPSTLEVRVTERIPVAAVPRSDSFDLMAADGVVVETVDKAPPGLPTVTEETVAGGQEALVAAAEVLDSLPAELRARVPQASAATRDSVQFELMVPAPVEETSHDDTSDKADKPTRTDTVDGTAQTDGVAADNAEKPPTEPKMVKVTVMWGSPEESALKAEVLGVLLKTPAREYDVSSPQTPVTR
jgi:cell division protein FtsQ